MSSSALRVLMATAAMFGASLAPLVDVKEKDLPSTEELAEQEERKRLAQTKRDRKAAKRLGRKS